MIRNLVTVLDPRGDLHRGERGAVAECILSDRRHPLGEGDRGARGAVAEGRRSPHRHSRGERGRGERRGGGALRDRGGGGGGREPAHLLHDLDELVALRLVLEDVVEAVRHMRTVQGQIRQLQNLPEEELTSFAKNIVASIELVKEVKKIGRMPVVNFAAGGVATPADAALMMQLGADGVFVGSGIFKSGDPSARGKAMVKAVTNYNDPSEIGLL